MKRRWQGGRADDRGPSSRLKKSQGIVPADLVFYSKTRIEVDEISAASEQNVLAIIYHFAGAGMLVGRSASTKKGTALKHGYLKATVGESTTGG